MKTLDNALNKITMYRLVLYVLIALWSIESFLNLVGIVHYGFINLLEATGLIFVSCLVTNFIFAKAYKVDVNVESVYITAFILALIIDPVKSFSSVDFPLLAGALAMSSKYLLSWHKKHIFNPAAIAVILSSYLFNYSASWWVGDVTMAVFVAIGSFLIIRKTRREDMTFYFLLTTLGLGIILGMFVGNDPLLTVKKTLLYSPVLFFAGVMLTEPLTTPPTKLKQIIYGVIAGILMVPQVHIGALYFTPELALVLANIYAFSVSSKGRKLLKLKRIDMLTQSIYDFVFAADSKFNYLPGQYIEYTLKVAKADSRGNRRYFTLASSPTEDEVLLGVKFYDKPSSFKETLLNLRPTDTITAFQVAGDFVLPQNKSKKLVFIAGGIGITPFRSMTKYLLDKNEPRDIILLYANKTNADIVYKSIFDEAEKTLGLKAHYIETDTVGRLSKELITTFVADAQERTFYISGPQAMVTTVKSILNDMNIPDHRIVSDFFPGFA